MQPYRPNNPDDSSTCQVCGSYSASWHYGAIVCEACKKFFIRSLASDRYVSYSCVQGTNNCEINPQTRSNCQSCRMLKCCQVGMTHRRNQQPDNPSFTIESFIKNTSCAVCSSRASGVHFGVITCEACKAFYRRALKNNIFTTYKCQMTNSCQVTSSSRTCRWCRFDKCVQLGMSSDNIKVGRKSNVDKRQLISSQKRTHDSDISDQFGWKRFRSDESSSISDDYSPASNESQSLNPHYYAQYWDY